MIKKRILISFASCFLILTGMFFVLSNVNAYDSQYAHPLLTKQIVELYNKVYQPNLLKNQKEPLRHVLNPTPVRLINT